MEEPTHLTVLNMSKVEMLRTVVSQRLMAAAEEIFGVFERTIVEYEEELFLSKRENERQRRLLDNILNPEVRLHRAVLSADLQQDPEPLHIKEEKEQPWSSQKGEQLQGAIPVKSDDDEENAPTLQLYLSQTEQNREPPASSSDQQMDTVCVGEDRGGSEPTRSLDPGSDTQANNDETPDSSQQAGSSDDLKQSREHQSDLNAVISNQTQTGVSVSQPADDDRTSDSSETETENDDGKETGIAQSEGDKDYNTDKKSLNCSECGKTFDPDNHVQSHASPSGDKPTVCLFCVGRSHVVTLRRKGHKIFRCSICNRQFVYKCDAVRHIRIHTGEKPYSCSVCGKRFTQSTGLVSHMRIHTGEKPHSCPLCPKRFIRTGVLARHMRVHTGEKPYSCSVCNTTFSLSQSLLKHMRIHTGEKPFSCPVCDKKFTQKGHLTQHMTVHTGKKSFSCPVCGRNFTRQSRVKNHKCVPESSISK
ncbi:zinc finger protein 250-like [Morone saxatilis]|uniref:zinc finger protein 250-like n=1 Tax=Morone saxatilis TaxID=34816 RepID=UPI0015E1EB16|nr:zinc finger protein 250-like [Morone saxatilis]